ncbi:MULTISPECIES: DUF1707 domain-containing protein [unclassified Corynebacterium]|uniref:DUF1707 SHOCT-like domain-containing protein n=1 Tax=unclassified Corynebacterium TaxID=2624378 RepID=UPI002651874D|nr:MULTISPECIES: DUF1707 domain-containing protein [unclassified Corynebacterium]MDN8595180.1 DUF1707 domain-containing protein [Corynebacterium sp. P4_F2]WKK56771.1 DUF1707 domain-containing protein [Corynebacterium sp. P4-C1]WKK64392.1 DUF1707 domain-containing protein [Corynebacterium sp. P8-C1]
MNQPQPHRPQQSMRPQQPGSDLVRLSDLDRSEAVARLSYALGEGRLDSDEFNRRCEDVGAATTHRDLVPLFRDLPEHQPQHPGEVEQTFTRSEIERARANGKNTRLGIFSLGSLASFAGAVGLSTATGSGLWTLLLLIIPALFTVLYIMKAGPDSWYAPSPRQLDRQRFRELQQANRMELERRKVERTMQREQLTGNAMDLAQRTLNRFTK